MDPITITLVVIASAGLAVRWAGEGVAHAAAGIRGNPSPSVQRWEARERALRAQGLPSRDRPGLLRVFWENAVDRVAERQMQKHQGRLEAIREMGPQTATKARQKALRSLQRRAAVSEWLSRLTGSARERLRNVAHDTHQVLAERGAEWAAKREGSIPDSDSSDERQRLAQQVLGHQQDQSDRAKEKQVADVIPFPVDGASRPSKPTEEQGLSPKPNTTVNQEGGQMSSSVVTPSATTSDSTSALPEPSNLETAIKWATTLRQHFEVMANKLGDDATTFASNATGFQRQEAAIEIGQSALAEAGFKQGGQVQAALASAAELAPQASNEFEQLRRLATQLQEKLRSLRGEMDKVVKSLQSQRNLADEITAQKATAGAARKTDFYEG